MLPDRTCRWLIVDAVGHVAQVDMLVGDIYGTDYTNMGLKANMIASSFGKARERESERERTGERGFVCACVRALACVSALARCTVCVVRSCMLPSRA
jgi:pantothenate kinase